MPKKIASSTSKKNDALRRGRPFILLVSTIVALIIASTPVTVPALAEWRYNAKINSQEYKQAYGHWQTLDIPEEFRLNTIHAALLPTGKVLLVAGSGNNEKNFDAFYNDGKIAVLKTAILDPETGRVKLVDTPSDLFCSGHALLHSGNLLVAGGTSGYELLPENVKKPAGAMTIHNENPDSPVKVFKKGTKFTSKASGKEYVSMQDVTVQPATKMVHGKEIMIHHSSTKVFVEAVDESAEYITTGMEQYNIEGLEDADTQNIYGQGGPMTLKKQDFRGDNEAYEFDPIQEKYIKVGDMQEGRWYPSLPVMTNGNVLAVSGLDNTGIITPTTEYYDPATQKWTAGPTRLFPTYPALFRTANPDVLFFSGSSAGYGPENKGRQPGFWNIKDNTFKEVLGLRDTNILETSASVFLPPKQNSNDGSQSSRVMLAGGGGVGESPLVTARTDIIDLAADDAHYTPGPNLLDPVRYLNMTVTPWDEVFATGGTMDYRAKSGSYSYKSFSYNPTTNQMTRMADAPVGRGYHSGSLLLPNGRILVFGGDPLFGDKLNTTPGKFEQRIDLYTPPQFFRGSQPTLQGHNLQQVNRGQELTFSSDRASDIRTVRLIAPSSSTHVTNIEQRSVAAVVRNNDGQLSVTLPDNENLLPNGWYMLFATDKNGVSSRAVMVQVVK
ncbi:MAG TPA: galactose oxidase early set domain-containing protein [Candidatus Saccharimonadales bacterium]